MKKLVLFLAAAISSFAAIGDGAPSIPSGYVGTHPRLGAPDSTYLANIWTHRSDTAARIFTDATNWDSASPANLEFFRHLVLAYMAAKQANDASAAGYLTKIKALLNSPSGTIYDPIGNGSWLPQHAFNIAYDWLYNDLDSGTRANALATMVSMANSFEGDYGTGSYQPFNDQFYGSGVHWMDYIMNALTIYSPTIGAEQGNLSHLKAAMDIWFNVELPAERLVIGADGKCGASNDTDTDCGGMWHEGWSDYFIHRDQAQGHGLFTKFLVWKNATGDNIFAREGWIKNIAYWQMYQRRPNNTIEPLGSNASRMLEAEGYDPVSYGSRPGLLEGISEYFNDPTLRGWSRYLLWNNAAPTNWEPSAWPFQAPDNSGNTANAAITSWNSIGLAKAKNFPGWGTLFWRTGWGEDDTFFSLRYGPNFWSHEVQDAGAFSIYKRAPLAINSATYLGGSDSDNFQGYGIQAISRNTILVLDPADVYTDENDAYFFAGGTSPSYMPNDGGQMRVGSSFNVNPASSGSNMSILMQNPYTAAQWKRSRAWYQRGFLLAYNPQPAYTYVAVDVTDAYNNLYSRNAHVKYNGYTADTTTRTYRVTKMVRSFILINRGTDAYILSYDQVISKDPTFKKTWLLHTIDQPTISGNTFTVAHSVTANINNAFGSFVGGASGVLLTHCPGGNCNGATQYIYDGKLYGWNLLPASPKICKVGGSGHEFDIGATTDAGCVVTYGTNHNACEPGAVLCNPARGSGPTNDIITAVSTETPMDVGAWRIEESPTVNSREDFFLNLMLATTSTGNPVSTAPSVSLTSGVYTITWKDNFDACTYTVKLPQEGTGGANATITAVGTCAGGTI